MRSASMLHLLLGLCLALAAPASAGRLLLAETPACNKTAAAWEYQDRCAALTSYQDGWSNASTGKLAAWAARLGFAEIACERM